MRRKIYGKTELEEENRNIKENTLKVKDKNED